MIAFAAAGKIGNALL